VLDGVHAAAIELRPQGTPAVAGTPTQVAGWGLTTAGGFPADVLMKADVPVIDFDECSTLYEGDLRTYEICAGTADGAMDACEGDDGGALVHNGTLVGVATFGNSCGVPGKPGIYTDAAMYTDWIRQNSGVTAQHA
jgi:secreted trypsin-like serine protease